MKDEGWKEYLCTECRPIAEAEAAELIGELAAAEMRYDELKRSLETQCKRWEHPAARWRKMRKAVSDLKKGRSPADCQVLNEALAAIDRVAGGDV